jgi:hypothetical protein
VIKADPQLEIVSQCDIGEPIRATPAIVGKTRSVRSKHPLYTVTAH